MLLDFAQRRTFSVQRWLETTLWTDIAWILRRRWKLVAVFALIGLAAGYGYTQWRPEEFVSRATVRFIPPQVAESYVQPNVAMQVEQRIFAVTQMLRSRLTATQLIERFHLYPQLRRFYPVADLVPELQEHLRLATIADAVGTDKRAVPSIEIVFRYGDAGTAQKVVQRVVELIYEENRRYRSDQSIGTTDFLQQEVQQASEQIGELEASLAALPTPGGEPRGYEDLLKVENLHDQERRLTDLEHQMNYVSLDRNLRRASIAGLESQLKALLDAGPTRSPSFSLPAERIRAQIDAAENRVAELQARYKPGQSERVLAEGILAKLQQSLAEQMESDRKGELAHDVEQVETQLNRARAELAGYEATYQRQAAEEARLREQIAALRAEFAPQEDAENERLNLVREYAIAKDSYAALMKRQRESEMASNMERRGQGETAEMVEPPTLPLRAEYPNSEMVLGMATLGGAFFGYLLALAAFVARPRVRVAGHVAILSDVPVFASLPGSLSQPLVIDVEAKLLASVAIAVITLGSAAGCTSAQAVHAAALKNGDQAYSQRDYAAARLHYLKAIQANARSGEAYWGLSRTFLALGDLGATLDPLIRAGELLPQRADVQEHLAETMYQFYFANPGRPASALREVEQLAAKLREKWPNKASGYRLQAQVLVERRHAQEAIDVMERALERFEDGSIRTQLASVYFQTGDRAKAEENLRTSIARSPGFSPAYDLLYLQLMSQQRTDEARDALEAKWQERDDLDTALQLAAHDDAVGSRPAAEAFLVQQASRWSQADETQARVGDFWLHRYDWQRARFWYEAGRTQHPAKRSFYTARLADLLMARKDEDSARSLIEAELKQLPKDGLLLAYQAALNLDHGSDLESRKKMQARLESLVAQMPNSPFVHLHLGRAYLLNGEASKAADQMQTTVALDPNYAPGWLALAEARIAMGHVAQAQEHLDALLKRNPGYGPAQLLRAQASMALQKPADAEAALTALNKAEPDNVEAALLLSRARAALGHVEQAAKLLEELASTRPNDTRVIQEQARLDLAMNNPKKALARLSRAEQLPGATGAEFQALFASVALTAGDDTTARDRFQKLSEKNPENLEFRLGYANSLALVGRRDEAAREYEFVQKRSSSDARPWLLYGAMMAATSNRPAERSAYEEALKRDPENPFALNNLAFLLARTGADLQKALELAERAKRRLPSSWEISDTLAYVYLRLGLPRNAVAALEEISQSQRGPGLEKTRAVIDQLRRGEVAEVRRQMENGLVRN